MTNVFPNSNLPTVCQPWGREIQKRVTNLESQFSLQRTNAATIDAQLQASYRRIDNTLNGIIGLGASGSGYTINADNINGGTITGTTLQTSATGQRVVVSNLDEIKFYDESGTLSLTMEGTGAVGDGTFVMHSRSLTNTTFGFPGSAIYINDTNMSLTSYIEVGPEQDLVGAGIRIDTDPSEVSISANEINLNGFIIDGEGNFNLGDISVSSIYSSGQIDSDGNVFGATLTAKNNGAISGGSLYTSGQVNADGNVFGTSVTAKDGGGLFGGSLSVSGTASSGSVSTGSISTSSSITSGGNIRAPGITSTTFLQAENHSGGGTTGASINNNGTIIRTSSSERYKQDIENLSVDYDDLLSLEPKRFRLKDEAAEDADARYYAGFIAEEIDQTSLKDFVAYRTMEDGSVVPDGVYYGELTAALLEAIKHQDSIIKSLTNRLEILENDKV